MKYGKLFLIGLPVGNWEDMSVRSYKYIKNAKNIVIEREEAFEKIWPQLGMEKPSINTISIEYDSDGGEPGEAYELHNMEKILQLLKNGEDVYLISDEGMPGVADPGARIVKRCILEGIEVTSTPGPSVVMAAVAVTGTMHNFIFESFLPFIKEERLLFLEERKDYRYPMVLMLRNAKRGQEFHDEIPNFLEEAISILGKTRKASLCYNLTMDNEKVVHDTLDGLRLYFNNEPRNILDQICIVIDGKYNTMN